MRKKVLRTDIYLHCLDQNVCFFRKFTCVNLKKGILLELNSGKTGIGILKEHMPEIISLKTMRINLVLMSLLLNIN